MTVGFYDENMNAKDFVLNTEFGRKWMKIFFCGAFHQQSYHLCFCFFDQGMAEKYKHQRSGDLKENHGVFDFELSREDMDLLKELDRS
jgi:hypothetical protein